MIIYKTPLTAQVKKKEKEKKKCCVLSSLLFSSQLMNYEHHITSLTEK